MGGGLLFLSEYHVLKQLTVSLLFFGFNCFYKTHRLKHSVLDTHNWSALGAYPMPGLSWHPYYCHRTEEKDGANKTHWLENIHVVK